ncbi:L-aspartate oxidase [Psychrobacter sp. DAB_AL32B]|uniref:L-aspartate oxidase n=1 Tax=Psychrobacter sp. DAB_AL32B TaxID=1028414 RepID=UPI000B7F7502|nr:L-aspartate oxidase [Psychrobacter sp. DAB_AL32B]OXL21460.1 L-aspartate oxidase [Psychrobacter sp. DAB_AL32B]
MSKALKADMTINTADDIQQTDVLIIGAGLAGLSTALALPASLSITVLSKSALEVCSSHFAQGGIAASLDKNDSVADHIADTLIAGAGLCAADNTANILSAGQQAVQWLCEQGVPFTQIPQENNAKSSADLKTDDLHLTKEGGHGCRRVAHADDATGRHVMEALTIKAQATSNITILPYHEALSLLKGNNNNQCQGAQVFDHNNQRQITFHSRAVVLASGGLGQLFKRASAPNVCVGDGVMMAWQAGCRLANLEFIQFHPTGLALGDSSFLISEALRGEGGRLYCPKTGKRFMLDVDTRAELAPRDIVARAIAEQINNNGLGYVNLDVSRLPAEFLQQHFPQIYQTLFSLGIDMTREPIPVAPTAHYSCGGVVTDANGVTDVAGLYAAGEVAYTGLHGANRLASNSLLECVVIGRNIAAELPRYLTAMESLVTTSYDKNVEKPATDIWTPPILKEIQPVTLSAATLLLFSACKNNPLKNESNTDNELIEITTQLKVLMTNNMGISRSAEQLEQALIKIEQWQQQITSYKAKQPDINNKNSSTSSNQLANFQLARQLQLATLIVQSAYQRLESRGGHYRKDYPNLAVSPKTSIIEPLTNGQEDSITCLVQPIIKHTEARAAQAVANI